VVFSSSPFAIVKPGVDVRKVTGPTNPDADTKVVENVPLELAVVDPTVGEPWTIALGVTARENVHVPASP
jgi:hypothetical protein